MGNVTGKKNVVTDMERRKVQKHRGRSKSENCINKQFRELFIHAGNRFGTNVACEIK